MSRPTSNVSRAIAAVVIGAILPGALGCRTTVDSLGSGSRGDGGAPVTLRPLSRPASYPNAFRDVLGKTATEIANKITAAFNQLFHGDSGSQAIYFSMGTDQAYIQDILHQDVRTEGIGLGMMIAVQLNKRDEFDRLWRYAQASLLYTSGANQGYFRSVCDTASGPIACADPYGFQQFLMALILAHDRWGSATGTVDYQAGAIAILTVMRQKESQNGGIVDGVTNAFDAATKLVFDVPNTSAGMQTRPSIVMPGYYGLWAQATADAFWNEAAAAGRAFWKLAAHPTTGLMPARASLIDGTPVSGSDMLRPEGYRVQVNIVLDRIWVAGDSWEVEESNRLLQFFASKGIATYGRSYSLDGATTLDVTHDPTLVVVNGVSALIATNNQVAAFVGEVWDMQIPTGPARYYTGILYLVALLMLGGQFQVY